MGPAVRPKPASPHGTPLPRKRATAGRKLPCHVRRGNHSTWHDVHRRALRSSVSIRRDGETQGRDSGPPRLTPRPASPVGERSGGCGAVIELPIPGMTISRPHQGDSQCNKRPVAVACRFASPCRTGWRMVGPVTRPKPASPHGTPLPRKRATADGKSPCHMRRWNHTAFDDASRRVRSGDRIGPNGVSPSPAGGAWWGPPPGRSRHPHMALRFRGSVLRPAENYRVTCAGGSVARSATRTAGKRRRAAGSRRPTVRPSGWRIRAERSGARWGPQSKQCSATYIALSPNGIRLRHGE